MVTGIPGHNKRLRKKEDESALFWPLMYCTVCDHTIKPWENFVYITTKTGIEYAHKGCYLQKRMNAC